ncbi:hypothetical protein COCON_G00042470 [Conger conger]|uniref:Uncharacterized protein n=1 Tax=Conger conger TaxID=82655 RepID=A0A9Q1I4V4_CONCO|nr:hypothetical protein COCON_G00042470 [Conger conger]
MRASRVCQMLFARDESALFFPSAGIFLREKQSRKDNHIDECREKINTKTSRGEALGRDITFPIWKHLKFSTSTRGVRERMTDRHGHSPLQLRLVSQSEKMMDGLNLLRHILSHDRTVLYNEGQK